MKWAYFTMGMMTGLIVLLLFAVIMQSGDNAAYARQGSDNNTKGIVMAVGGATQQQYDLLWVLHEHQPLQALQNLGIDPDDEDAKALRPSTRMSLMLYKAERNGQAIKLIAARDISYDQELIDWPGTEKPKVTELRAELHKQVKRKKD